MGIHFSLAISLKWLIRKLIKDKRLVYLYSLYYGSFRKILTITALSFCPKGIAKDALLGNSSLSGICQNTQDGPQIVVFLHQGE